MILLKVSLIFIYPDVRVLLQANTRIFMEKELTKQTLDINLLPEGIYILNIYAGKSWYKKDILN